MRRILLFLALAVTGACAAVETDKLPDGLYAEFTTPRGVFVAQLFYDKAPLTCGSFVGLAEGSLAPRNGQPFFTGLRWYRVVPNFVIQSGDPDHDRNADKEDAGHPHTFPDELVPGRHHDAAGVLSMANAGPDTNSCEFFLTLRDTNRLNYLHSVFGRVVRGVEVLPQIKQDDACSIKILRIGAAAQAFDASQTALDSRRAAAKKYAGPPEPGPAAHFDDPDKLLPQDVPRAKNFNFKLANFERVTGKKIYARIFAKSPPADEDKVPGAWMHALAEKLGTAADGVLAVHFADENDWRLWIGDEVVSVFLGRPGAAEDLAEGAALHKVKTAFIAAAVAQGDAEFAAQQKASTPDKQPPPAQRLKLQTDALLDGLIFKLE